MTGFLDGLRVSPEDAREARVNQAAAGVLLAVTPAGREHHQARHAGLTGHQAPEPTPGSSWIGRQEYLSTVNGEWVVSMPSRHAFRRMITPELEGSGLDRRQSFMRHSYRGGQ